MIKRTTTRLPEDLLNRRRRKAAAEGRTVAASIEDGLRTILSEGPIPAERRRVKPWISKAMGGLMLKVDLTNLRTLQEHDDIEFVQRMQRCE
jgi:hypothetical protein